MSGDSELGRRVTNPLSARRGSPRGWETPGMEGFRKEAKGEGGPGSQDATEAEQEKWKGTPAAPARGGWHQGPEGAPRHSACCRRHEGLATLHACGREEAPNGVWKSCTTRGTAFPFSGSPCPQCTGLRRVWRSGLMASWTHHVTQRPRSRMATSLSPASRPAAAVSAEPLP